MHFPTKRWIPRTFIELLELMTALIALIFTDATHESLVMGAIISFAGASLFTWAGGFRRMEREGVLTLGGPYRFVRHPWILARFLMVFGVVLMARLPWLFLFAMCYLTPLYRRMTREEDQWLYSQLGPLAAEYKAFVAGFIPQFLPAKLPVAGKVSALDEFSWKRALWKRPGRGALAIFGVGLAALSMILWNLHVIPIVWWRVSFAAIAVLCVLWLSRDRSRRIARPHA
jgi:protein-S-isoprenylcysteine O-methyltransferase Ste14